MIQHDQTTNGVYKRFLKFISITQQSIQLKSLGDRGAYVSCFKFCQRPKARHLSFCLVAHGDSFSLSILYAQNCLQNIKV